MYLCREGRNWTHDLDDISVLLSPTELHPQDKERGRWLRGHPLLWLALLRCISPNSDNINRYTLSCYGCYHSPINLCDFDEVINCTNKSKNSFFLSVWQGSNLWSSRYQRDALTNLATHRVKIKNPTLFLESGLLYLFMFFLVILHRHYLNITYPYHH